MKMIKNEFKFIFSNRLIRISLFAIMFIPFLYSVFFLRSVWDPYGSTGNLPIAVVNEDKKVTYEGQKMHAGADMVKQLKHNTQIDWHFVSKEQAEQGIKDHKYYTVVTLPKNFSANAATVLDAHPKKMEIKYKTNDSLNYIATVVSDTAAESLNSQVKEAVTTAYTKVIFDQVTEAGKGFKTAATGAQKLNDGSIALSDGLNVYTGGVAQVNDGVMTLKMGVSPLASGVNQLAGGSSTLNNGLQTLNSKTGALSSGASQLSVGANQLNDGLKELNGKTGELSKGTNGLKQGADDLSSGLDQLTQANNSLNNGAKNLSESTNKLELGSETIQSGLTTIQSTLNNDKSLSNYEASRSGYVKVQDQLAALQNKFNHLDEMFAPIYAQVDNADYNATAKQLIELQKSAGVTYPEDDEKKMAQIQGALAASLKKGSQDEAHQIVNGVEGQLKSQITDAQFEQLNQATAGSIKMIDSLQSLKGAFNGDGTAKNPGLVNGINQITNGLTQMQAGIDDPNPKAGLVSGISSYTSNVAVAKNGSQQLAAGTNQLSSQVPALTSGVSQLAAGSQQLATGTSQLNSQVPALTSGVSQLADGSNILYGGLSQLQAQIPTLSSGVDQLALGTSQLVNNSGALIDGANQLKDGNGTLASGLKSGSDKIGGIKITDKNIKQFVTPAKLSHSKYSSVPNYGYALAPYVLSLALYVGAIVFNFAFPIRKISTTGQSATAWFFSKAIVAAIVAIAMAVIEPVLMMLAGLHAEHPAELFLMTIIFSLASMAIVMFLSMVFDNPGRFVAMLLLMLQLGGSGGTFPMEMTNHFYNVIHPYLPMSYSVLGLRQAMTSGLGMDQIWNSVGVLLAIAVVFTLLTWVGMYFLQKHGKAGKSQLDNNQSLQALEK